MSTKFQRLRELALKRQAARWPGYRQIADFHGGVYECEYVSPYTKSAHNLDASVFVILHDWSSEDRLSGPLDRDAVDLGRTPSLPSNRNLDRLLHTHFGLELSDTYATNLFPFIKPGSMSAPLPFADLVAAAREYALPQVSIVSPRLVVCLGLQTFRAFQRAAGHRSSPDLDAAISNHFAFGSAAVWCQAGTGALGQNNRNRGGVNRVAQDWSAMRAYFQSAAQPAVAVDAQQFAPIDP